ncbi:MAG: ring-cleaving dioxygenase [Chloroflexota bacterium]
MNLNGLHHVTSVSAKIGENAAFYTRLLGLRLVKKSVNQDDTSAYHLFYADKVGSPGTDMTFFDWAHIPPETRGTDSIVLTAFRVNGREALDYWVARFDENNVSHEGIESFAGKDVIRFEDFEGQRLMLVDDEGAAYDGEIWEEPGIPIEYALRGFYAAMISVPQLEYVEPILTKVLAFEEQKRTTYPDGRDIIIYNITGDGGAGNELWVLEEPNKPIARQGYGATHHIAFRVADKDEQGYWRDRISSVGLPISGFIDRFYFNSIYFRISNGILFEIATDGPGFDADEDMATLGEKLALPPFLEPQRELIEAKLKPINMPETIGQ